jgi:hypothetical protein
MGRHEINQPLIYTTFPAWIVHKNIITQLDDDVKKNICNLLLKRINSTVVDFEKEVSCEFKKMMILMMKFQKYINLPQDIG